MNQKEALVNLLVDMSYDFRLTLVSKWLEDINFHKENSILLKRCSYKNPEKIKVLDTYDKLTQKYSYHVKFVEELEAKLKEENKYQLYENGVNELKEGRSAFIDGQMIHPIDVYNYRRTNWYGPFNYIFCWGVESKDWKSGGGGEKFVDELINDLINKE